MRHLLILSATLGALAAPARAPSAGPSPALAAALKGRTAGAPVDCISLPRIRSSTIVDSNAIIYKEGPRRWYVNSPASGCPMLDPRRAIVTRIPSTRLCRMDLINIVDLPLGFEYGACALGSFVPWMK